MSESFDDDLKAAIGDKIQDDEIAKNVWSALANVDWYHPKTGRQASYSFRAAGGLIAELRGSGDYLDWYCCGPYAEVSDFIRRAMKKQGWIPDTSADICDEPECLKDAGCGWPTEDGGYRYTCHEHMKKRA